jgi:hypothetical protein
LHGRLRGEKNGSEKKEKLEIDDEVTIEPRN